MNVRRMPVVAVLSALLIGGAYWAIPIVDGRLSAIVSTIHFERTDTLKAVAVENADCEKGSTKSGSELCAAWATADATQSAAKYAFWAAISAAVGTLFLLLTLAQTRKTSRAQLRAYLSVEFNRLVVDATTGEVRMYLQLTNNGQTPAYRAVPAGGMVALPDLSEAERIVTRRESPAGRRGVDAVAPGKTVEAWFRSVDPFSREQFIQLSDGELQLVAFGTVHYDDIFGRARRTHFCYTAQPFPLLYDQNLDQFSTRETQWDRLPYRNDAD